MAGTNDNQHANALMQAPPDEVIGRLVDVMRETRPEIVITHDPTGGYMGTRTTSPRPFSWLPTRAPIRGSLRRAVSRGIRSCFTTFAFRCFPRSFFRRMWQYLREAGIRPPFASEEVEALGTPDDEVTTAVDVEPYLAAKIASLNCQRTQIDPQGPFHKLPTHRLHDMMRNEYFTLALPNDAGADAVLLGRLAPAASHQPGLS